MIEFVIVVEAFVYPRGGCVSSILFSITSRGTLLLNKSINKGHFKRNIVKVLQIINVQVAFDLLLYKSTLHLGMLSRSDFLFDTFSFFFPPQNIRLGGMRLDLIEHVELVP